MPDGAAPGAPGHGNDADARHAAAGAAQAGPDDAPLAARDWIGEDTFPWPAVGGLDEGDPIAACYCVVAAQSALTKYQKPYLKLQLSDRHGSVEARVWEDARRIEPIALPGAFVGVRGRVEIFNGGRQIRIDDIRELRVEIDELDLFMPRSPRDPASMARELDELILSVRDRPLRTLLQRVLGDDTDTGRAFRRAPAAKMHHHAYVGGLLEHTLSVAGICDRVAEHYGPEIDRDLVLTGALLHDLGKIQEIGLSAGFPYTDRGKLLGHILVGLDVVGRAGGEIEGLDAHRLDLVLHLIASHQGRYEWQSPREPRVLEAVLLHHADDMDAKMQQALDLTRAVDSGWTDYSRTIGGELLRHRDADQVESERERLRSDPASPRQQRSGRTGPERADDSDGEADGGGAESRPAGMARERRQRNSGNERGGAAARERDATDSASYDLFES